MMIILGLGNPGPRYFYTRHNIGFIAVDSLAAHFKIPLYKVGYHSYYGKGQVDGREILLAKPMTFMNASGEAAVAFCHAFGVLPAQLLVILDDLDLPLGEIRLRPGGGSGGHKGLDSIIFQLETQDFPRMRVGIGRPEDGNVVEYVLQQFGDGETPLVDSTLRLAVEAATVFVREGISQAMNFYNRKK